MAGRASASSFSCAADLNNYHHMFPEAGHHTDAGRQHCIGHRDAPVQHPMHQQVGSAGPVLATRPMLLAAQRAMGLQLQHGQKYSRSWHTAPQKSTQLAHGSS